ncbi:MAG: bacteriohemerythrin [Bacteroidales bacterium]
MGIFEWKDNYSVSINSIDNDHKRLFELMNQLFDAMTKGEGSKILLPLVDELHRYTAYHFNREEVYFRTTNYPNAQQHVQQHTAFVDKVGEFKAKISAGKLDIAPDLLQFLRDWLLNHILKVDRMYTEHFKKFGVQ